MSARIGRACRAFAGIATAGAVAIAIASGAAAAPHAAGADVSAARTYAPPAGTQPFPNGPFAARVVAPRILPESATAVARVLGASHDRLGSLQFSTTLAGPTDGSVPVYLAHESDPHYTIHCMRFSHCPLEGADVAIPRGARPASNFGYVAFTDDGTHDQHLAVRNVDTRVETDMWLAPEPGDAGGTLEIGFGRAYPFDGGGYGRFGGATAAGFALSQGRIRAVDLLAGRIPYALFLVTPCENGHVAPATGDDGGHDAGCPPIGARVWLDASPREIDAAGAPPDARTILRALHEYGGYVGDRCTSCTLGVQLEGGLSATAFGLPNPWSAVAARYPDERPTGPQHEYHIAVRTGSLDLMRHLHLIAYP